MANVQELGKNLVISFMRSRMLVHLLFINVLAMLVNSVIFADIVLIVMLVFAREKHSVLVLINHCHLSISVFFCALFNSVYSLGKSNFHVNTAVILLKSLYISIRSHLRMNRLFGTFL
jgi:hypothetical protein